MFLMYWEATKILVEFLSILLILLIELKKINIINCRDLLIIFIFNTRFTEIVK